MQPPDAGWGDDLRLSRAMKRHEEDKRQNSDERFNRSAAAMRPRETTAQRSHRVFDDRQRLMHEEFSTQSRRMRVAEEQLDAVGTRDPVGTAQGSLKELEELETMLAQRMRRVEETTRAISNASEKLDADAGLARARAEAEAWAKGNATTRRLASNMSSEDVHKMVTELNSLRLQVRTASAELHKIKLAAGGDPVDVARFCQADMERVAKLRGSVELELATLKGKLVTTREELKEAERQAKANRVRVDTYEEQMAERADAVVVLEGQLEAAKVELEKAKLEGERGVHDAVRSQHTRMLEEHRVELEARTQQLRDEAAAQQRAALEQQRAMLEDQAANRLEEKLAEQHHVLVSQLNKEMQDALTDLQRDLNDRNSRHLEALRNDMTHERETAVAALQQRLRTVENRAAGDLESARGEHDIELENALDEQRRRLEADLRAEKKASLEKLETTLTNRHRDEMNDLRQALDKRIKESTAAGVRKATEQLQKKLENDFALQRHRALHQQEERLTKEKNAALKKLQDSLSKRNENEVRERVRKELKAQEERLSREQSRDRAREVEKVATQARGDKTAALKALRERMEAQHATATEKLRGEVRTLNDEVHKLRQDKAQAVESLRSGQRKEMTEMKESLRSRKDAHVSKQVAPLEEEVARLNEQVSKLKRSQAAAVERALAEHRVAKTRELDNLRTRLDEKRAADLSGLEAKVADLSQENRELKRKQTLQAGRDNADQQARSRAVDSLKGELNRLLHAMQVALVPRKHAPLDASEASPSPSMGKLNVLINGLSKGSKKGPDVMGLPSATPEAVEAPAVTVDVLLSCGTELCQTLADMAEEIKGMHTETARDWKVLRKRVEDELRAEFNLKMQDMQLRMSRQLQAAGDKSAAVVERQLSQDCDQQRADMEKEMHEFKLDLEAKKHKMKQEMQKAFDAHVDAMSAQMQETESENEKMIDALIAETDELKDEITRKDDYVQEVLTENAGLADEVDRLRQQLESNPRFLSPPEGGVANTDSSLSMSPRPSNAGEYDGRLAELDRLRLEKRISNLQAAVEQLLAPDGSSEMGTPPPPSPP